MLCPYCGQMNDDFQTVCMNCGEPLTPGFVMCPVCGKVLKSGEKVCPRCNSNLIDKTVIVANKEEHIAITPKYVVKAPLSFITSLSIMCFFIYSLAYNIVTLSVRISSGTYDNLNFTKFLYLVVSTEIRPFICLCLSILSIITLITRVAINRQSTTIDLDKRLVNLKCLLLADVTGFFTYFLVSFWPTMFTHSSPIYVTGGILGLICLFISIISLPLFYKRARVRTR